jgi:sec-independent protein translocase protein TatB
VTRYDGAAYADDVFDIGIGEIMILAVLGLLVFGPERLPKAAADAVRMLKQVRGMAANARQDLADSAGIDMSDTVEAVRSLGDLHPRKLASGLFSDEADAPAGQPAKASPGGATSGTAGPPPRPAFDPDAT